MRRPIRTTPAGARAIWAGPTQGWVVAFYNRRGTAGLWIKEIKHAVRCVRLSCRSFGEDREARGMKMCHNHGR